MNQRRSGKIYLLSMMLFVTVIMACSDTGQPIKGTYSNESLLLVYLYSTTCLLFRFNEKPECIDTAII